MESDTNDRPQCVLSAENLINQYQNEEALWNPERNASEEDKELAWARMCALFGLTTAGSLVFCTVIGLFWSEPVFRRSWHINFANAVENLTLIPNLSPTVRNLNPNTMHLTLDVYTSLIFQFLADLAWIACIAYGDDDSSEFLANLTRRIFILKVCFPPWPC